MSLLDTNHLKYYYDRRVLGPLELMEANFEEESKLTKRLQ